MKFVRLPASPLFVPEFNVSAPRSARVGFVLWDDDGRNEIALKTSWGKGAYAMLAPLQDGSPIDWARLGNRIRTHFLEQRGEPTSETRFGWFKRDGEADNDWIQVNAGGGDGGVDVVARGAGIALGVEAFQLALAADAPISVRADTIAFGTGFVSHFLFVDPEDRPGDVGRLDAISEVVMSFKDSASAGTVGFRATLEPQSLADLGVHLRFSKASSPDDFGDAEIHSSRYTLFTYDGPLASSHVLDVRIDVHLPYEPKRSYLAFAKAKEHGVTPATEAFMSYFETTDGHRVGFIPLTGARLVLVQSARVYVSDVHEFGLKRNYLTPDGPFELLVPGDNGGAGWPAKHRLLTGLSRTEYLEFVPRRPGTTGPGNVVNFQSGAPGIDFREVSRAQPGFGAEEDDAPTLTYELTTAWLQLRNDLGPRVGASRQPERMVLHGRDAPSFGADSEPRLLSARAFDVQHAKIIPVVPLLGLARTQDASNLAIDFDRNVLSAERGKRLAPVTDMGFGADETDAFVYTPQGFEVKPGPGGTWSELVISRVRDRTSGADVETRLSLLNVDASVVDVMMRNRVFAVFPNRTGPHGNVPLFELKGQISIAGWQLNAILPLELPSEGADVGSRTETTIIVKSQDRSIVDLLADPTAWSNRKLLAKPTVARLQESLTKYIAEARERREEERRKHPGIRSRYQTFLDAVEDPEWNGFLVVDVQVDLSELPLQIKGLLGGIDLSQFRAHHLGVLLNRLERVEAKLKIERSALFGLVDYPPAGSDPVEDPAPPTDDPHNDAAYDFKVESLSVLFENAEISRFDCRVKLFVGSLFSERANRVEGVRDESKPILAFEGQYESRVVDGARVDTYTFIHKRTYVFELDTFIFKQVRVIRLQFTTISSEPAAGGKERIRTRIAFWGNLEFQNFSAELDFPGIERLDFDDLGITFDFELDPDSTIKFPKLLPNFDVGSLRFELPDEGFGSGFLPKLPFKLKFFQFAPRDRAIKLSDEGFFGMSLSSISPPAFRFGLGFDLDLGSLGALASKLEGIRLTTLLGWMPKGDRGAARFCVGLRFEGGGGSRLDIGLQGILRLTAEKYEFKKVGEGDGAYYMLVLQGAHLYILGQRLPEDDDTKFSLFIFTDPANLKAEKLGWFAGLSDFSFMNGAKVNYLGVGQRVNAYPKPGVPTTRKVIEELSSIGVVQDEDTAAQKIEQGSIVYAPDRDWTVAFSALVYGIFDLDLLFMDPDLYGARLRVPSSEVLSEDSTAPLFDVDVLYRKITDDLGVYSMELTLPDYLRQLEFGAASITVPTIGLEIWTDGGFAIDLGHPGQDLDFARSFTVQVLPFLGSGGLLYSRINGRGAQGFPQPVDPAWHYDPVIRVAFAARVGLGKEIRKGILRAGLSVSVFGMVEGTWAERRLIEQHTPNPALPTPPGRYSIISGRYGVIGEVFGYVDFGIVRAGVSIRIWASTGVILETWHPTVLFFEAGVSVRVSVVIARIKVFGKRIEVRISFSFSTRLRYDWKIGTLDPRFPQVFVASLGADKARLPFGSDGAPPEVISWNPDVSVWGEDGTRLPLNLWFTPDATLDDAGEPHLVTLLAAEGGPAAVGQPGTRPFDKLIEALLVWAIRLRFAADDRTGPVHDWSLTIEEVDALAASLSAPFSLSRSDGSYQPLDYPVLRTFLQRNFDLTIVDHPADDTGEAKGGALFPAPSELALRIDRDGDVEEIAFSGLRRVTGQYQDELEDCFERMLVLIDQRRAANGFVAGDDRLVIELLFEDYFGLLLKNAAEEMRGAHISSGRDAATVAELLGAMARDPAEPGSTREDSFSKLAAMAGRYQMHGLRVKAPHDAAKTLPFFGLAELQRPLGSDGWSTGVDYKISLTGTNGAWFAVNTGISQLDSDVVERMRTTEIAPMLAPARMMPEIRGQQRRYGFGDPIDVTPPTRGTGPSLRGLIWSFSEQLRADLRRRVREGAGALDLALLVGNVAGDEEQDIPIAKWRWVSRIPIQLKRVQRATDEGTAFVPNVYELGGTTEVNRYILDRLIVDPDSDWWSNLDGIRVNLVHERPDEAGAYRQFRIDRARSFVFRNNLSAVARPHGFVDEGFGADDQDEPVYAANFSDASKADLLELIRQGSIVNSGGYYLHLRDPDGAGLPESLFASEDGRAQISLVLTFDRPDEPARDFFTGAFVPAQDGNLAAFSAADASGQTFLYARSETTVHEAAMEPGTIGLQVVRAAPSRRYKRVGANGSSTRGTVGEALASTDLDAMGSDERDAVLERAGSIEVELEERFNLLEWEIPPNDEGFTPMGGDRVLPIGPGDLDEQDFLPEGFKCTDWLYEQVLPVYKLAEENAWASCDADRNVYAGIGRTLPLVLRFRDVFGNRLPGVRYSASLDVRYFDRLVHPTSLPGVKAEYDVAAAGSAALVVELTFDASVFRGGDAHDDRYDPDDPDHKALGQRIRDALTMYTGARRQLEDGNVEVRFDVSLSADPAVLVTGAHRKALTTFCAEGEVHLRALLETDDTPPAVAPWSAEISASPTTEDLFVEIRPMMVIARPEELVAESARAAGFTAAWRTSREILPAAAVGTATDASTMHEFAERFEAAFADFVLASGVGTERREALWAVGRQVVDLQIDWTQAGDGPVTFASPPLSTELRSADFDYVDPTDVSDGVAHKHASVRDVDLDNYMRAFIQDLERFLSPDYATHARRLAGERVDGVLEAKRVLARAFAGFAEPVLLDDRPIVAGSSMSARAVFEDRMLTDLVSAYDVDSVLAYPLVANDAFKLAGGPSVYGRILPGELTDDRAKVPYVFRPVKVRLDRGAPWLIALFDSKREYDGSEVNLHPSYAITHVERKFAPDDYRPTAWLELVLERVVALSPPGADGNRLPVSIPVPLRRFPQPPGLSQQDFAPSANEPPADFGAWASWAREWQLTVDYRQLAVDQDSIHANVTYNNGVQAIFADGFGAEGSEEWLNAVLRHLVVYRLHRETVWASLNQLPLGAGANAVGEAVKSFSLLAVAVAEAFDRGFGADGGGEEIADRFVIDEDPLADGLREITTCRLGPESDRWASAIKVIPISSAGREIPIEYETGTDDYRTVAYRMPSEIGSISEGIWLRRRMLLDGLDVLATENAWAGVELRRNERLVKDRTTSPSFIYRTAPIRFGDHITPTIRRNEPVDITGGQSGTTNEHVKRMLSIVLNADNAGAEKRDGALVEIGWGYDNELLLELNPDLDPAVTLLNNRAPDPMARLVALNVALGDQLPSDLDTVETVASTVSTAVDEFRLGRKLPVLEDGPDAGKVRGSIVFQISVYARTEGENKPILLLGNLRLPLARIG